MSSFLPQVKLRAFIDVQEIRKEMYEDLDFFNNSSSKRSVTKTSFRLHTYYYQLSEIRCEWGVDVNL